MMMLFFAGVFLCFPLVFFCFEIFFEILYKGLNAKLASKNSWLGLMCYFYVQLGNIFLLFDIFTESARATDLLSLSLSLSLSRYAYSIYRVHFETTFGSIVN